MTNKKNKRRLFPLHLTPFESYMFVEDSPEYPMTFVFQFDFQGALNRSAFQDAIDQALMRHPMLRCHIRPAKSSRDCWVLAESYDASVDWGGLDDPILIEGSGVPINLRESIGLRTWVRHDDQHAKFVAVFHHSAVDGIGAYQFLGDVFWFYAKHFGEELGELREYSISDLRKRLRANVSPELAAEYMGSQRTFRPQGAQPIRPHRETSVSPGLPQPFPQFQSRVFDKAQYREFRLKAQEKGQTVNDGLLESLFVALASWNQQHGADIESDDFCVLVPMDLRTPEQVGLSAVNVVTSTFVRRSAAQIRDREQLSKSLREEIVQLKHTRFRSEFMGLLVAIPIELQGQAPPFDKNYCHTTTIFSNAGDPTRRFLNRFPRQGGKLQVGNLLLEEVNGASPLRNLTRASFNAFTYERKLKIGMRCDPQVFSNEDGKRLLDHFVDTFVDSMNG